MGKRSLKRKKVQPILNDAKRWLAGDSRCQKCGKLSVRIDSAHARKSSSWDPQFQAQRWLPTDDEHPYNIWWFIVAFLCRKCHRDLEHGTGEDPHKVMLDTISAIFWEKNAEVIQMLLSRSPWASRFSWSQNIVCNANNVEKKLIGEVIEKSFRS